MGHTILYNWQFLRSQEGITPVILAGCSNVTTQTWSCKCDRYFERLERSWYCLFNMIGVSEEDFFTEVNKCLGTTYQEHWKYKGKWINDQGFVRWAENAVKSAVTLEDVLLQNSPIHLSVECYVTVWPKETETGWGKDTLNKSVHTTQELDDWIVQAKKIIREAQAENRSAYPIIKFSKEKFTRGKAIPPHLILKYGKKQYVSRIGYDERGDINTVAYTIGDSVTTKACIFDRDQYKELMSNKNAFLLKGTSIAAIDNAPYDAIITAMKPGTSEKLYLYRFRGKMALTSFTNRALRYKNLNSAQKAAVRYKDLFAAKGYSLEAISI